MLSNTLKSNNKKPVSLNPKKNKDTGDSFLDNKRLHAILGSFLLLFSIFLTIILISYLFTYDVDYITSSNKFQNWGSKIGALLSKFIINDLFGISSFLLIPIFFFTGFRILFKKSILIPYNYAMKIFLFFLFWGSVTFGYIVTQFSLDRYSFTAGAIGIELSNLSNKYIGIGTPILLVFILLVFSVFYFGLSFDKIFSSKKEDILKNNSEEDFPPVTLPDDNVIEFGPESIKEPSSKIQDPNPKSQAPNPKSQEINSKNQITKNKNQEPELELSYGEKEISNTKTEGPLVAQSKIINTEFDPTLELSHYKYPVLDLLTEQVSTKSEISIQELETNKSKIVETLSHYDIEIAKIKATIGPTVTLYEIVPAAGVRISKIKNLEDDIALSLAALGIRIIAPMPGKGTIGIEVPNSVREIVSMRTVLSHEKFQNSEMELPVALGKTISNEVFLADLAKMPHLLMAGATGQGKSAGLNAILTSLLYKKHPSELKFVLVDPKKVELTNYKKIEKHFLAKLPNSEEAIITDVKQVVYTLNSLCLEMDLRYDLMKEAGCRNIKEYNHKFKTRKLNPLEGHRFLPYIVLVLDELADLMLTAGKEVENPICRLAQLARAIGIHLVIATQRPSVNVITGLIKANFPVRLSFKVSQKVDSKIILDVGGADQLVGQGDLLLSINSNIYRLQGAFIDTPEVDKLCDFISQQQGYSTAYLLPEPPETTDGKQSNEEDSGERDPMFNDAAKIIVMHQQGSTSLLQRRLKLGYNRAGRLIDQLEKAGIVGPFEGSKAREVLVKSESDLEQLLRNKE